MRFARRLDAVPPYLFAELERRIAEKRATGVDVISLGIGDPDLPSPAPVVDAMQRAVADPARHRYPTNQGLPAFREAVAEFYRERRGEASRTTAAGCRRVRAPNLLITWANASRGTSTGPWCSGTIPSSPAGSP